LKNSARNCSFRFSSKLNDLNSEKSQLAMPGPMMTLRPSDPQRNGAATANALVSKK